MPTCRSGVSNSAANGISDGVWAPPISARCNQRSTVTFSTEEKPFKTKISKLELKIPREVWLQSKAYGSDWAEEAAEKKKKRRHTRQSLVP